MESGVATRPIADFTAYRERLNQFVFRSGLLMRPMFESASSDPRRSSMPKVRKSACCARARWSSTRAWREPILIGRREVVMRRIEKLGLRIRERQAISSSSIRHRSALQRVLVALPSADGAAAEFRRRRPAHGAHATTVIVRPDGRAATPTR